MVVGNFLDNVGFADGRFQFGAFGLGRKVELLGAFLAFGCSFGAKGKKC